MSNKTVLYTILGLGAGAGIFAIVWQSLFPKKPATAGTAAGTAATTGHSAGAPSSGSGTGTTTPTNSGSTATDQNASTNLGYTVVAWNDLKVGDKLNANEDTALYRTGQSSYTSDQVTIIPKGNWVGQVVTKYSSGATVRNWSVPGEADTIFNIPIKSYRKIL